MFTIIIHLEDINVTFFSMKFVIFLIVVFVIYYIIPSKYRYIWCLISSYLFYTSWNVKYTAVLFSITLISYFTAFMMKKWDKRICLGIGVSSSLIVLMVFKFWNFWSLGFPTLFGILDKSTGGIISIVAPIGLSFFVLVAIGYMVDVYRGDVECETNIGRYALFISFFPTVLSGPIERSSNLLQQIRAKNEFSYAKVKRGLLLILWGYFLKLLIANRLAIIVNAAFENRYEQTGATMMIAVIFYGIQLYADFAGYSFIAVGIGKLLGFDLIENFKQPYFAKNIRDFWVRWHISLSSWLKDYVYIPLGGNRKGKARQCINLMFTFLVSGIWHGAGWKFVIWGAIHGIYQVIAKICLPIRVKISTRIDIKRDCFSYKLLQRMITFGLVDFAWLFFRASSTREALSVCKNVLVNFQFLNTLTNKLYLMGYDEGRFYLLLAEIIILLLVDIVHERKISIVEWLDRQNKLFRWIIYLIVCLTLAIGIIHDYGTTATAFIYTRF